MQDKDQRYDKDEDRDNDQKSHDNPNHDSGYTNTRNIAESDDRAAEKSDSDD